MKELDISFVMPALNEEANILDAMTDVLATFDRLSIDGELIVVNDGSSDRTPELVRDYSETDTRVRIINHERPYGIGNAFWEGVDYARGKLFCMLPGDNENDPYEILRYYPLLDHVDIVIPFIFNREVRPWYRNALSTIYRTIINTTFLVNFNYTNGTVMYRSSVLKELEFRSSGFFYQTDILVRLIKRGYIFAEVPYRLRTRANGVSKALSFPSLYNVARGYINLIKDIYYGKQKLKQHLAEDSKSAMRNLETKD